MGSVGQAGAGDARQSGGEEDRLNPPHPLMKAVEGSPDVSGVTACQPWVRADNRSEIEWFVAEQFGLQASMYPSSFLPP